MKKIALLLVFVMLFSLAACKKTPAGSGSGGDTAATTTTTAPASARTDVFTVGTVTGGTYENAYFGLGCTLGSEWAVENAQSANPSITGEDFNAAAAAAQEFYDMQATNTNDGSMISVRMENLPTLFDFMPTVEEYIEMQNTMFDGNPDLVVEEITADIGNLSCKGLKIAIGDFQVDTFYFIPFGNYMITVGFSAARDGLAAQYLPSFYTF